MLKKVFLISLLIFTVLTHSQAQPSKTQWVDSVFNSMDEEMKIGQLFMIPVSPASDDDYIDKIEEAIKSHHIGGIVFKNGSPSQVAEIQNFVQKTTSVPLLTGIDAGRGLGETIDSAFTFPSPLILGAINNDTLLYHMGRDVARQMKLLNLHLNFAPLADVGPSGQADTTYQFFGEQQTNVTRKSLAYMKGLQDHGILSVTGSFPVHGITVTDVRKGDIPLMKMYVDTTKVASYLALIKQGVKGIQPALSSFPIFYEKKNLIKKNRFSAGLLSKLYANEWLKKTYQYDGLVVVDIEKIVDQTGKYKGGDAEVLAFIAGNDLLVSPHAIGPAIRKIKRVVRRSATHETALNDAVRRILAAKYDAGLYDNQPVITDNLVLKLNGYPSRVLNRRILENAVTVVRNERQVLPIKLLEDKKIGVVSVGKPPVNAFSETAAKYKNISSVFSILSSMDTVGLYERLEGLNTVIVGIFGGGEQPIEELVTYFTKLQQNGTEVVITHFGSLTGLPLFGNFPTVVQAYTGNDMMLRIVPQTLFGALSAHGKLPVAASPGLTAGTGVSLPSLDRLQYSFPEDAGLDGNTLSTIESIAREAIKTKGTPGCHVLVAKGGKVVYEKSFGYLTYDSTSAVTNETIYDLASITKVAATLQAVMFMHDRGLIDIYRKASSYLPELKRSNKKDYTLKDVLTHQAGLWPYLPFWAQTVKDTTFLPNYYHRVISPDYPFLVAEDLYASRSMRDSLWSWIVQAKIREKAIRTPHDYRYSDMGFYILQQLSERILNQPLEDFLHQNFYEPLGAHTMGYLPLNRFSRHQIAPTENDKLFRRRLLVGTVHDQGAAMMGGVAGHAGLFSNANDLAKLGQMLLQEGSYGGIQYFKPETVRLFTAKQYTNSRRGLGWDKPVLNNYNSPTSVYASPETFGHTGFTGTCIWVDPEFDLVYVFLSNRVHPDMTNNKLLTANIRSRIQDTIYQAIFDFCVKNGLEEIKEKQANVVLYGSIAE